MGNTQQKLEVNLANLEKRKESESKKEDDETEESELTTFTCEICIEPMPSTKKFRNNDKCVHPFCVDCLAKYIKAKLEDNVPDIDCPSLNCAQLLDPVVCRTIISVDVFNKWCDFLCESSVLVFRRCYCPYENCSSLIINECEENKVKKTKCPNCKRLFCYACEVPWHAGYWCSESRQRRDVDDVAFGELVEKFKWTRCPFCGQAVELLEGCKAVKCRYASLSYYGYIKKHTSNFTRCGHSFCHRCGEKLHFGYCNQQERSFPNCLLVLFLFCLLVQISLLVLVWLL